MFTEQDRNSPVSEGAVHDVAIEGIAEKNQINGDIYMNYENNGGSRSGGFRRIFSAEPSFIYF